MMSRSLSRLVCYTAALLLLQAFDDLCVHVSVDFIRNGSQCSSSTGDPFPLAGYRWITATNPR
jgi:hypothetical protein